MCCTRVSHCGMKGRKRSQLARATSGGKEGARLQHPPNNCQRVQDNWLAKVCAALASDDKDERNTRTNETEQQKNDSNESQTLH